VTKTLGELVRAVPGASLVLGRSDTPVTAITHDSRAVRPGAAFVALAGQRFDGTAFVSDAVRRGAAVIVSERAEPMGPVAWVRVHSARRALADLAAAWYDYPSARLRLIGVTGTDGKTTTTRLIGSLLEAAGRRCGWYTTADLKIGGAVHPNTEHHTTPEADRVQAVLAAMVEGGADYAVLEASSHALAQDRLRACAFDVGVFTNLSAEHLDYHGSLDAYLAAKARLFTMLGDQTSKQTPRYAILNADQPASQRLRAACPVTVVTYSLGGIADVWAEDVQEGLEGFRATIATVDGRWPLVTRFIGRHNASNWLAALAVALREGVPVETIQQAARSIAPPPGRLQPVQGGQPFGLYVDFAHTPQALRASLSALRAGTAGRLLLAFGHAGNRTRSNRPELGRIAAELADYFVITNDDAHPENPEAIADEIEAGVREIGATKGIRYTRCLDRRSAIHHLLSEARAGDVVLLAGKGHESFLHVAEVAEPWSDVAVAQAVLAELGYSLQPPPR
jgi:UDP-N-acetylmuramoyl-L-alanyl-D-glutamate--2,6-diaminopimelate ligase